MSLISRHDYCVQLSVPSVYYITRVSMSASKLCSLSWKVGPVTIAVEFRQSSVARRLYNDRQNRLGRGAAATATPSL